MVTSTVPYSPDEICQQLWNGCIWTLFLPSPGEVVAQASLPAGSGGVSPRESDQASVLAAGRCGNPQPGRLRYMNGVKLHPSGAQLFYRSQGGVRIDPPGVTG